MTSADTVELPDNLWAPEPQRRRPRWGLRIGIVLAVLVLLAGAAEVALRMIIPSVVASSVREQLQLPITHPVEVELHGSALLPAVTGKVGPVTLIVPNAVVFDGIEATLQADAQSMPFDPTRGEIIGANVSVTIPSSSMSAVVSLATHGMADSGEIRDGELLVGRSVDLFGVPVTVTASLKASIEDGDLLIEPTGVSAAGFDLTAEQLRSLLGETAASVLDVHTVCVRDQLPAGINLTRLTFSHTALGAASATVTATLDPDIFSNTEKHAVGSCSDAE